MANNLEEMKQEAALAEHIAVGYCDGFAKADVPHVVAINGAILILVKLSPMAQNFGLSFRKGIAVALRQIADAWELGARVQSTTQFRVHNEEELD